MFFNEGDDDAVIVFADGADVVPVLDDSRHFEFYLTDRVMDYLICSNDHDFLIASGSAQEWLRRRAGASEMVLHELAPQPPLSAVAQAARLAPGRSPALDYAELQALHGQLVDDALSLLVANNPVKVGDDPVAAYRPVLRVLLHLLPHAQTVDDARRLTHQAHVTMLSSALAGCEDKYEALAGEIWALWQLQPSS